MLADHIGVTYAGMGPDFRLLVRLGRKKAQDYYQWFKEPISVLMMVKEMANIMQEYTQSGYWILLLFITLLSYSTKLMSQRD
jgi:20S proteasome subunit alpha 2